MAYPTLPGLFDLIQTGSGGSSDPNRGDPQSEDTPESSNNPLVRGAQAWRGFWNEHPVAAIGSGFVPFLGQGLGIVDAGAAYLDPEASQVEKGLATAGILPVGKLGGPLKKIIGGSRAKTFDPALGKQAVLETAKRRLEGLNAIPDRNLRRQAALDPRADWVDKKIVAEKSGGYWTELTEDAGRAPAFEISDAGYAMMIPDGTIRLAKNSKKPQTFKAEYAAAHDELYKNYPDLKSFNVVLDPSLPPGTAGQYLPHKKTIRLNPSLSPAQVEKTLLHELQHAVSIKETFPGGLHGVQRLINDAMSQGVPEDDAIAIVDDLWRRNYGEISAEFVADRFTRLKDLSRSSGVPMEELYKLNPPNSHITAGIGSRTALNEFGADMFQEDAENTFQGMISDYWLNPDEYIKGLGN